MRLVIYEEGGNWVWEVIDIPAFVVNSAAFAPRQSGLCWSEKRAIKRGCRAIAKWRKIERQVLWDRQRKRETLREIDC